MSKQPNGASGAHDQPPAKPAKSAAILLLGDIANTTWRMFVPTIGLLLLGTYIDSQLGTKPIALLVGAGLGFLLAIWLIIKQVKDVSQDA